MKILKNIKAISCCDAASLSFYRCGIESVTLSGSPSWLSMNIEPGKSEASLVL